jgi:hypothetical protein
MSDSTNPFDDLVGIAWDIWEQELARWQARRCWPADYRTLAEFELTDVADECLRQSGKTLFGPEEVERRVGQLKQACVALMCWRNVLPDVDPATDCDRNLGVVIGRADELAEAANAVRRLGVTIRQCDPNPGGAPDTPQATKPEDQQARAIALLFTEPDWTLAKIAEQVGVDRHTFYKPSWHKFREAATKAGKMKARRIGDWDGARGSVQDRRVEAYRAEDD